MNKSPKYWVACSGGVDSVVLTHLMHQCVKDIGILHCNFQLRGKDSDKDEAFVKSLAKELDLPVLVKQFEIDSAKNTQLQAREMRYAWFEEIKQKHTALIFLGHHADDQVETFFMQLERGGSIAGLVAMPTHQNGFVRPLLHLTKNKIQNLARKNSWKWRDDASNFSEKYQRNFYRLQVLPTIEKSGVKKDQILALIKDYQALFSFLLKHTKQLSIKNTIAIQKWQNYPILLQKVILISFNISSGYVSEITKLSNGDKGGKLKLNDLFIWNEGDHLYFEKTSDKKQASPQLNVEEHTKDELDFQSRHFFVDADKLKGKLSIRKWELGDRFQPLGMNGSKLISAFLIDKKVPSHQKSNQWVLHDDEKIVAVWGFTISELVKIDNHTKQIKKLSLSWKD